MGCRGEKQTKRPKKTSTISASFRRLMTYCWETAVSKPEKKTNNKEHTTIKATLFDHYLEQTWGGFFSP